MLGMTTSTDCPTCRTDCRVAHCTNHHRDSQYRAYWLVTHTKTQSTRVYDGITLEYIDTFASKADAHTQIDDWMVGR
jgi:hypothetical protein